MKIRLRISIITITLFLFLTSCGCRLRVMPGEHFTKQTTLSIGNYDDAVGTVKELNYLLALEGFNVVSSATASNAVKYRDPLNDISKNKELQKAFNITDLNSIYSIKLKYRYFKKSSGYSYKNFRINIIDPNGRVIMYGYYLGIGNENTKKVLEKIAKKLAQQIK